MKSTGLLFCAEMVRALLDGRKTQTRRVVKPQPNWPAFGTVRVWGDARDGEAILDNDVCVGHMPRLAYGVPRDYIWCRETWQYCPTCGRINFRATANEHGKICQHCDDALGPWKPGVHLFQHEARIRMPLTAVRVERLQEITEDDALAEGIDVPKNLTEAFERGEYLSHRNRYFQLWDRINGKKHPWSSNPWVWVLEWKPLK